MNKEMQAVVFTEPGKYEITTRPVPEIKNGNQMLVKILAASICGTDVHILADPPEYQATPNIILGHEFVGEVIEVGDGVRTFQPGDRLICDNNLPCGVCPACQEGHYNVCTGVEAMGVQIDGIFTQYAVVPESSAVKIAKDLELDRAIFAEPVNCVIGGVKQLKVMPGDSILILGGGPIGIYYESLLKQAGAGKVFVSEVSEFRSDYVLKFGADRVINPQKENLKAEIMKETDGCGVDIVVDAVGVLINDALDCVKMGGQILLFGLNENAKQTICQSDIARKNIKILGSFIGNYTLRSVAKALETGVADFRELITHRLPLGEFETGLEAMRNGTALEVVLYPFDDIR